MIKIGKYTYIHVLTVVMFAMTYITGTLGKTAIIYTVMLMHELAHTAAAAYLGLGIGRIVLYPFGVNLRVQSRMIASAWDEVILYLAGPLVNIIAALFAGIFIGKNLFYYNNIILFVINMLPVLPLDGGQIMQRLLSEVFGQETANIILRITAIIIFVAIFAVIVVFGGADINSFVFCAFLFAAIFTQNPKYSRDFVKELAITGNMKKIRKADVLVAPSGCPMRKIAGKFNSSRAALVVLTDEENNIEEIFTKEQVINTIINK